MNVLIIDNYDSFTFNLVHYLLHTGVSVEVFRNDAIRVHDIRDMAPHAIVISPARAGQRMQGSPLASSGNCPAPFPF